MIFWFFFSKPGLFLSKPSRGDLFVSNPRSAVPSPAVRAHRTAPPRAPPPKKKRQMYHTPGLAWGLALGGKTADEIKIR